MLGSYGGKHICGRKRSLKFFAGILGRRVRAVTNSIPKTQLQSTALYNCVVAAGEDRWADRVGIALINHHAHAALFRRAQQQPVEAD